MKLNQNVREAIAGVTGFCGFLLIAGIIGMDDMMTERGVNWPLNWKGLLIGAALIGIAVLIGNIERRDD
jgi:hypothetical protein